MSNSLKFLNCVKHKGLSPLLAYKQKSILPTSDFFPLIMSQIYLPTTGKPGCFALYT